MEVRNLSDLPAGVHPRVAELYQRPFFKQGTDEWLEQRYDYLTASDVGAVLGKSIFKNQDLVRAEKLREGVLQPPTEAMKHGTKTEPEARAVYERQTGNSVIQFGLLTGSEECQFLAASVDGITTDGIVVEIKCPYSRKIIQGKIPEYNLDQVQAQLAVTDLDVAHYFEYDSKTGETNLVEVQRDQMWMESNKRLLWDFWIDIQVIKKIGPARDSISESDNQQFLVQTWTPKFVECSMAEMRGDYLSQLNHYIELGLECERQGEGYVDRALSCYVSAEKIAVEYGYKRQLFHAAFRRSQVYCSIGERWYGVGLAITALKILESLEEKDTGVWEEIAYSEIYIGDAYLHWAAARPQDDTSHSSLQVFFWLACAIRDIQDNNLQISLNQDTADFYNNFLNQLGVEKGNQILNDPDMIYIFRVKSAY
jgi:putative phage-type endonuclease